jgi:5'-nucleotidase / UDP-sugar diphosphatase
VHREGRTVYVHSGSWNEFLTLAFWCADERGGRWEVRQQRIATDDPAEPALAKLIRDTETKHLTAEDTAVVGRAPHALSPEEAAGFVVAAVRMAAGVDAALIGRTTFGAGLPAGEVTRAMFDACVRFDGTIHTGEVSGAELQALLAVANETTDTPFAQRRGDYLVAQGPETISPERRYRIATTDWVARNAGKYLGATKVALTEQPALRLKRIATVALNSPPTKAEK